MRATVVVTLTHGGSALEISVIIRHGSTDLRRKAAVVVGGAIIKLTRMSGTHGNRLLLPLLPN